MDFKGCNKLKYFDIAGDKTMRKERKQFSKHLYTYLKRIAVFLVALTIMLGSIRLPAYAMSKSEIQSILLNRLYQDSGGKISCDFDGYVSTPGKHEGIDCVRYAGHPVYSITDGEVVSARQASSGLTTIAIYNSSFDVTIIYLHTKSFAVSTGSRVSQGQKIALEGSNGASAAHTHVELRPGRQNSACKSVNDYELTNPNPYPYYEKIFGGSIPDFEVDTRYPTPFSAYPLATSGLITVYNGSLTAYSQSEHNIAYTICVR